MAISTMQQPRQQYGLGKLVKKAFKGVKKVFKSPIGKAAILGGLGMYGMGMGPFKSGKFGAGFLKGIGGGGGGGIGKFFKSGLGRFVNPMSGAFGEKNKWKHAAGLLGLGAVATPFVQKALGYGPYQDEEVEDDWTVTPGSISNIVSMARAQDPSLNFLPSSAYTQSGFYGADGGIVGLANGGNPGEAQMEQMLRAEYLKYKNKGGTMPYEQFKILVMKQAQQGQMPNQMMAAGGRSGFENGEMVEQQTDLIEGPQGGEEFQETVVEGQEQPSREQLEALAMEIFQLPLEELDEQQLLVVYKEAMQGQPMEEAVQEEDVQFAANGGRMGFENGELVDDLTTMEFMQDQGIPHSQMVSAPHPDEGWMGLWEKYMEIVPPEINTLPDFKNWFKNQDFDEDLSQWGIQEEDIEFAARGGRMGFQEGGWNPGVGRDERGYQSDHPGGAGEGVINTSGNNKPIVNPVGPNYPAVNPTFNTALVNKQIALNNFMQQREEDEKDKTNVVTDQPSTFSSYLENLSANPASWLGLGMSGEGKPMTVRKTAELKQTHADIINKRAKELGYNEGGRIGLRYGGSDDDDEDILNQSKAMSMYRTRRQEGGLMDLQGQEKDYRDEGGFVALGGEERADDVPARLSKNEFVFTADAVRAAGGGDIDAGSEVMQNVMDNLEQGGEVSEESQGQNPAQGMYNNYEQLKSRVA